MKDRMLLSPFSMPIIFFGAVIIIGTLLLHHSFSLNAPSISWIDALLTSTSATCVTGLVVVDTGSFFNRFGQTVIMGLMQIGGLGIMTFTSLIFYLWRRRVSLTDRISVGQSLLHDPSFHLGRFLVQIVVITLVIEMTGASLLFLMAPSEFTPYFALFHSVSAFCNAGFSLFSDNLVRWQGHSGVNMVFIGLIVLGSIGFSVLMELLLRGAHKIKRRGNAGSGKPLTWYTRVVLQTSVFLILGGWAALYLSEFVGFHRDMVTHDAILSSLFQSVTCRTAGFNTFDISQMTNVSLLIMTGLMFIGGASGSCAGGIKVSTFRILTAFAAAQLRGRKQAVAGKFAVDEETLNKAMVLLVFSVSIIAVASLLLNITEGGDIPHAEARGRSLEILFETVSAFGTVGLSTGLTPRLTDPGKLVIVALMFMGRLGPILFIAAIQNLQKRTFFQWPEESMLVG